MLNYNSKVEYTGSDLKLFLLSRHACISGFFASLWDLQDVYGSLCRGVVCLPPNNFLLIVERLNCFEVLYSKLCRCCQCCVSLLQVELLWREGLWGRSAALLIDFCGALWISATSLKIRCQLYIPECLQISKELKSPLPEALRVCNNSFSFHYLHSLILSHIFEV